MMQIDHEDPGSVDIYDPGVLENPFGFFDRLRNAAPVVQHHASGVFQISRFDLVKKALLDTKTFSNEIGHALHERSTTVPEVAEIMKDAYPTASVLHTADGSVHKFSRQLVNRAFSSQRVTGLTPRIIEVADQLIDGFASRGSVELMSEFAQMLPLIIIAEQLGVPTDDIARFNSWSSAFASRFSHSADEDTQIAAARSVVEFQHYFAEVLREKKQNPTDDMISIIASALEEKSQSDQALSLPQALQLCQQILVAGNESTASTISEGMVMLLQDRPDLIPLIRTDGKVRQEFAEEALRLHSAVTAMWRVTTKSVELGGCEIPEGSLVLLRFASGNRDETVFEDAGKICPGREGARRHLAFGFGIHVCIGAQLARTELEVAFERLFNRLDGWRIRSSASLDHKPSVVVRALAELQLEFEPDVRRA